MNIYELIEPVEDCTHVDISGIINEMEIVGDIGIMEIKDEEENFVVKYGYKVIKIDNIINFKEYGHE